MSESGNIVRNGNLSIGRTAVERAKSMRDIMEQFSRIDNKMYREYLDYAMDKRKGEYPSGVEDEFMKRRQKIRDIYDRYEVNMANDQGFPITRHGEGGGDSKSYYLHNMNLNKKAPRSVYAKKK